MPQTVETHQSKPAVSLQSQNSKPLTVLVVEDDHAQRAFFKEKVEEIGFHFAEAQNGVDALSILRAHADKIDIVLMDRIMPLMDGLTVMRRMRVDPALRMIPVIMLSDATRSSEIQEAIEAGVFYYLAKPVTPDMLGSVLAAAARQADQARDSSLEIHRYRTGFDLIETCKFRLRTLDEAEYLSEFIAQCFAEPQRVIQGIRELMINAVEHGNLEIGYARKTDLIENNTWRSEIERRLSLPEYKDRYVEVTLARRDDGIYFIVTDHGGGFNWQRYMTIDPSRAADRHGRGIAQANALSFDSLTYNTQGNQAIAFVGGKKRIKW